MVIATGTPAGLYNIAQGLALCKWITPSVYSPLKGLIIVGGCGAPSIGASPYPKLFSPFRAHASK